MEQTGQNKDNIHQLPSSAHETSSNHQFGVEIRPEDFWLLVNSNEDYAILLLDPKGCVRSWNKGAEKIKGWKAEEIIGKPISTFYRAIDIKAGKPEIELCEAAAKGRFEDESWRVRKNGTRFWANVVVTALRNADGSLRGFAKVTRDLTERREAEERYRLLVGAVKDYAIFMLDPTGKILTWNAGAEAIKGYKAEEIIGQHFSKFYMESDRLRKHPQHELEIALKEGRYEEEGWRVKKDGSRFWANVVITRATDEEGSLVGFSKVTRDLTERRALEEKLKVSDERFRLLMENVKDYGIILLDVTGHVVSWNLGAERIKGWKAAEIEGRHFSAFYPQEDIDAKKPEMELAVATREGRFEDYGWRLRKDGSRFFANVIITALRDADGDLKGFGKVTRDITEKRQAEEKLRDTQRELEREVKERTEALTQASALNKELEAFSYSVSHDLRAPLRSMDGFSRALIEHYPDCLDARGKDYLNRIRESSTKMGRLIEDLLNLSRLSRAEIKKEKVCLSAIVTEVERELLIEASERKVTFSIQPDVWGVADPTLIRIVLQNLLDNAWKFTSKKADARIEFGVRSEHGRAVHYVRDNGAGFDMTYRDKLFGAFQRLHTLKEFPGTGIGLASIKRILHRHGGDIWAEGEVEKGASFYFTLDGKE